MILGITIPIIVQNGITNFVNLLDNVMVGRLGTEQLSGVGIANQLIFDGNNKYKFCWGTSISPLFSFLNES